MEEEITFQVKVRTCAKRFIRVRIQCMGEEKRSLVCLTESRTSGGLKVKLETGRGQVW